MTLYITGGHLTPALALIDEMQKKNPEVNMRFIGREFSQASTGQQSRERDEVERRDIPFFAIDAPKLHRTHLLQNMQELLKIPRSLTRVLRLFRETPPGVVLSFGGYVAVPVCILGKIFGARVITHEQTKVAGLANQVIGWFADTVALAHEESRSYFPQKKVIITGNPIREALFREYKTPPAWMSETRKVKPLLYVTGGSQGSQVINHTIENLLSKLTRDYYVVHQCGASPDSRVQKDLLRERGKLAPEQQDSYTVREWIDEREVSFLLRNAMFVICRSGANTVQELLLAATPAIFIPLAFAYNDEQAENARSLVDEGASLLIEQKELVPEKLMSAISKMRMNYESYKKQMEVLSGRMIKNGASRLRQCILKSS